MSFSYDLSTDVGKVRLRIGDVFENAAMLSDEEINAVLADYSDVDEASIHAIDHALAKIARQADSRSAAGLSAQRANQFSQLTEVRARLVAKSLPTGTGPTLIGPSSIADKGSARSNTDREASRYERDQWTNTQR